MDGHPTQGMEARLPSVPPSRYAVGEVDGHRVIVCLQAPGVYLHVERGLMVTEQQRLGFASRTIFLDGVFDGPPFYDNTARQYSLDHHTGCVRPFTLATCEQAAVMLMQGLPLGEEPWHVYANEPDMDTLLASWLLLNHGLLMQNEGRLLWDVMPLVRVEGVIDAHGLGMGQLSALPELVYREHRQSIDRLLEREKHYRTMGDWSSIDLLGYTHEMLDVLDRLLLPGEQLDEDAVLVELRQGVLEGNKLAILCRSSQGIYEAELVLKERHGKKLAIIILDKGAGSYTLRLSDPFLEHDLRVVYPALDVQDPLVDMDERPDNHWGGSGRIGGSPRQTGSGLSDNEVLDIILQTLA